MLTQGFTTILAAKGDTWIQIAKQGKFKDPRYGKFQITQADFDKWLSNFATIAGENGLPIDVDHAPEKKGETEAAGWILELDQRGQELYAKVEWNSLGKELIADKRYKFISPSYAHDYKDEGGKGHGTALVGVALTNRPFLSMAAVSLSKDLGFEITLEDKSSGDDPKKCSECDKAMGDDAKGGKCAACAKKNLDSSYSPTQMPTLLDKITTALSLSTETSEDAIVTKVTELLAQADKAPKDGQVVLDATKVEELTRSSADGTKALEALSDMKFETAFDKALSEGRMAPAMKDTVKVLYKADATAALKLLAEAGKIVPTDPAGDPKSGEQDTEIGDTTKIDGKTFSVDPESVELDRKVTSLMAKDNLDYGQALDKVMAGETA